MRLMISQIVGLDEVGRGAWAGPLVAAAVILNRPITGLKDSKLLTKNSRTELAKIIHARAYAVSLGWVWPRQIDTIGLTKAIGLAMRRALSGINLKFDQIIIDGNYNYLPEDKRATVLIRADVLVPVVSAASIIAKVARDDYMANAAKLYPNYFFDRHVGYGTKAHLAAIQTHGACDLHRLSYKPLLKLRIKT